MLTRIFIHQKKMVAEIIKWSNIILMAESALKLTIWHNACSQSIDAEKAAEFEKHMTEITQ